MSSVRISKLGRLSNMQVAQLSHGGWLVASTRGWEEAGNLILTSSASKLDNLIVTGELFRKTFLPFSRGSTPHKRRIEVIICANF